MTDYIDETAQAYRTMDADLQNPWNLQDALIKSWENAYEKKGRGENTNEWDLARRISAVTEGDTLAGRVQHAIKDHEVYQKVDEKLREKITRGQSEEEFYSEVEQFGAQYRKALDSARREVK